MITQQCLATVGRINSLMFQLSQNFYVLNFLAQNLNDQVVFDVHHWFVADGTFEEKFKCICEGKSFAALCLAGVELVVFLIFKSGFQFL